MLLRFRYPEAFSLRGRGRNALLAKTILPFATEKRKLSFLARKPKAGGGQQRRELDDNDDDDDDGEAFGVEDGGGSARCAGRGARREG